MTLRPDTHPGSILAAPRRLLALLLALPRAAGAAWRDPILRLLEGLAAQPDEAALQHLLRAAVDFARPARFILAGQPGATPAAEARLAHALEGRFMAEWRRRIPQGGTIEWLEERSVPPSGVQAPGALVLARFTPSGEGSPVILGFHVEETAPGPRIVDFHRDGVSLMRTQRAELGALVQRLGGLDPALAVIEAGQRRAW